MFRRSVCVFAAPVGDGGSGGRLDRSAAGDEGFLPVGTWRTVSGLYRPGTASAEGPPCSKHRAWSVYPHFGLDVENFMWSPSADTASVGWTLHTPSEEMGHHGAYACVRTYVSTLYNVHYY